WWTAFRKRPADEERTEKDRQEAGLEELDFPTVTVPNLSDVDDRHVHHPQDCEQNRVRVTAKHNQRKREANPGEDRHPKIGAAEPKQGRNLQHAFGPRTELRMNVVEVIVRGSKSAPTHQRNELSRRHQKRDRVDESEQPQNDESR